MQTNAVITITGSVIRPESRTVTQDRGDQQVTSWSMALNDIKDKDNADKTIWFRVSAWGKDAKLIEEYCCETVEDGKLRAKRGAAVQVTGTLSLRPWTDRDGNLQKSLEVRPFSGAIRLMNERSADEGNEQPAPRPAPAPRRPAAAKPAVSDILDDLPF